MNERPSYRLPANVLPRHYALVIEPDLKSACFLGEATIDVDVIETTDEIILNAAELEISSAEVSPGWDGDNSERRTAKVCYIQAEEQVVLDLGTPLEPGPWQVHLRYEGRHNDKLRGFYRSLYKAPDGNEQWLAVTQFESTDARRAFPCWDEPEMKATFGITIVADENLTVLSNGPEVSSEPTGDGKRRVTFADTVKMSTYLVAMAVGPFVMSDAQDVDGVPLRIGYVPGRAPMAGLAAAAAAHALRFLREYFSVPYPAAKLDHIAVPDFAAGAMENLGLVIYRETALLVPEESAQAERQRVVSVIGHETAHMWFGDLVTMRWWEGIWLNEAFATFMEKHVTAAFAPTWGIWEDFALDRVAALATDSLRSTRAIEYQVGRPQEAENMFDVITYEKGASVLSMIEHYLGPDKFRQGLHNYLAKHQFSNTQTHELWDALEQAAGVPVRATLGTWVDQPGHPVVSVEVGQRDGKTVLNLAQKRFLLDGGTSDGEQLWVVPLTLRYAAQDGSVHHLHQLMDDKTATLTLESDPRWALVNEGAWGVYRTRYEPGLRAKLLANLDQLDERERLSLSAETWGETLAGGLPLSDSIELWDLLKDDECPEVWSTIASGLGLLDLVCPDDQYDGLGQLVRDLAGPTFSRLGWSSSAEEPNPRLGRLRAQLVYLLGTQGQDAEIRRTARQLLEGGAGQEPRITPDLATAIAHVAAAGGGAAEWELLYRRHNEGKSPQDVIRYMMALASFNDPELLRRSADLAFSGEVRLQDAFFLIGALLSHRASAALAWDALESHWDDIEKKWLPKLATRMLESLPGLAAAGPEVAQRALDLLERRPVGLGGSRLAQAKERLLINLAFGRRVPAELGEVLAQRRGNSN